MYVVGRGLRKVYWSLGVISFSGSFIVGYTDYSLCRCATSEIFGLEYFYIFDSAVC